MGQKHKPIEVPRLVCLGLVGIGYFVALVSVAINTRYGQRMSVDFDGWLYQGAFLLAIGLGPAALMSYAGFAWKPGGRVSSAFAALIACVLISFAVWNVNAFFAEQMLGKIKKVERQRIAKQDITEIQNNAVLAERKETREELWRTYRTTKDLKLKDDAFAKLEAVGEKPITLQVPLDDVSAADERTSLVTKWTGLDKETVQGITPFVAALVMALVELCFPFLGFSKWPQNKTKESTLTSDESEDSKVWQKSHSAGTLPFPRRAKKHEALEDYRHLCAQGFKAPSEQWWGERWHWPIATTSRCFRQWETEGLIKCTRYGRGKATTHEAMPALFLTNGHATRGSA